jgi:hypothetical protein
MIIGALIFLLNDPYNKIYSAIEYADNGSVLADDVNDDFTITKNTNNSPIKKKKYASKVSANVVLPAEKEILPDHVYTNEVAQNALSLARKNPFPIFLAQDDNHNIFLLEETIEHAPSSEKTNNRLWVGGAYSFTNSTLLNHNLYKGFDANSLIMMHNFTQHNFALAGGYKLNEKYSLSARIAIANSAGQKHSTYVEGNFTTSELIFNYHRLSFGVDKKLSAFLNPIRQLAPLYFNSSIFVSKISSVELHQSSHTTHVLSDIYSSFDTGVSFALSTQINLSNKLRIVPQIETSVGLINLFKGDGYVPASFNKTQSLSISPGLVLSYSF